MKVPYNWLREYVDIPYTPTELAHRLTMAGIEVGAVQTFAPLHDNLVAARIEELHRHPAAGNLQVVKVDAGHGSNPGYVSGYGPGLNHGNISDRELLTVVCGAWNIKKGDMVALALPGAVLPDGREIRIAEIKGVTSAGMLCSASELGLDLVQPEEGILQITEQCLPGNRLVDVLFVREPVLELELTPNRGDCLGLLGVAREVAAQAGVKIKYPPADVQEKGRDIREFAGVEIREPALCPRYTARMMEGFKIAPSPLNMQLKLLSAGVRAIDNLVDVTNYVMLEAGFPMHAFDHARLEGGRIIVRRARAGETIVTLDGVLRKLDPEILVIADAHLPVALAGVMGGESTEITPDTTRLLLEVASFSPVNVRRTAGRLNLPSEAAQRYEKGVDSARALQVQNRAVHLIQKLAGGKIYRGIIDEHPRPYRRPPITLRTQKVNEILGYPVSTGEIERILGQLGLKTKICKQTDGTGLKITKIGREKRKTRKTRKTGAGTRIGIKTRFGTRTRVKTGREIRISRPGLTVPAETVYTVKAPSFRRDLLSEIDLIEEIARLKGFEHIPATLPYGKLVLGRPSRPQRAVQRAREVLVSCGLQEIITFSFMNPRLYDDLGLPPEDSRRQAVQLQNPLTEEQKVLRTMLLPNILQVMQYNFHRQVSNQFLFELGKIFIPPREGQQLPQEKMALALALSGKAPSGDWQNPPKPIDYYYVKGLIDTLLQTLGCNDCGWEAEQLPLLHPTRGVKLLAEGAVLGFLGALHPAIQEKFDLKQEIYVAEFDLESLINMTAFQPSFQPLPRYPAIFRDVAFTVPFRIAAGDLLQSIRTCAGELLEDVTLFDVYQGAQIPAGHRSLAFALTFRHQERTLKDEEVEEVLAAIENTLHVKHKALLRKI